MQDKNIKNHNSSHRLSYLNRKDITKNARTDLIKKRVRKKQLKRKFRLGENEKEIIRLIGIGVLVASSFVLPGLPVALKPFMKSRGKTGLMEILEKLSDKKIVDLGGEKISLTARGKKLLREMEIAETTIPKPAKWDGIWHLVSYDIPTIYNKDRDYLRLLLKRWGFHQIQESLWVLPYECKEEVAVAAEYLGIADYVVMMNTDYLPNEEEIENMFNL